MSWKGDIIIIVIIDTGISVTVPSHDVVFGLHKRRPNSSHVLQMVSGETLPFFEVGVHDADRGMMPSVDMSVGH
jgi:hypothetical protein